MKKHSGKCNKYLGTTKLKWSQGSLSRLKNSASGILCMNGNAKTNNIYWKLSRISNRKGSSLEILSLSVKKASILRCQKPKGTSNMSNSIKWWQISSTRGITNFPISTKKMLSLWLWGTQKLDKSSSRAKGRKTIFGGNAKVQPLMRSFLLKAWRLRGLLSLIRLNGRTLVFPKRLRYAGRYWYTL